MASALLAPPKERVALISVFAQPDRFAGFFD